MAPDPREAIKAVFSQALDLPECERDAFVEGALEDTAQRAEVNKLLRWYSPDYLAEPAVRGADSRACTDEQVTDEEFGPYTIIRELGHGGMGIVYLAQRQDELAGYQVALKVISAREDRTELEARLRMEMRMLTRLKHPHIVSVHDAGITTRGRVYLAMEYVDGIPLDLFCREHALGAAGRLKLFLSVCDAVAYAHQHLVVHRDLKPSNILVTADGQPKLVDFGLAKILSDESEAAITTAGRWRISLLYASPEQVSGANLATTTDVYSLGVILYELLLGESPYGPDRDPVALMRAVLSKDPVSPREVQHGLDADLSAILLKALRKEPNSRYASVDQFRHDIDCYLRGLPVPARHGHGGYVLWKFLRRHARTLAATAVILTVLGAATVSWDEVQRARRDLDIALQASAEVSLFLEGAFVLPNRPSLIGSTHRVTDVLFDQIHRIGIDRKTQVEVLHRTIDLAQLLGYPTGGVNLGDVSGSVQILHRSLDEANRLYARHPSDSAVAALASRNNRALGTLLIEENDYGPAAALFRRSLAIDRARMERFPHDEVALAEYADSLADLSRIAFHERNGGECLRLGDESIRFRRLALAAAPSSRQRIKDVGHALSNYCGDLVEFGQYRKALDACRESSETLSQVTSEPGLRRAALRLLADNAENAGRAYGGLGRGSASIASLKDAVHRLRMLREEVPVDTTDARHLAMSLSRLAEAEIKAGAMRQARVDAAEAVRLAGESAAGDTSNVKAQLALEEIRKRVASILGTAP